jgi:formamidopyrimidine-DNA glycosylase
MPELPEVETIVRGLGPLLEGRILAAVHVRRPDLRLPLPRELGPRLEGRRVTNIGRRAKYILIHLDSAEVLLCHLGMTGRISVIRDGSAPLAVHDHVIMVTDDGQQVRFNDARRFGVIDLVEAAGVSGHKLLRDLGPEPLGEDFDGPTLARLLADRRTSLKAALVDQRVVAGLGNIYACESLFFAGLSPRRLAYTVRGGRAARLAQAVRHVLTRAIEAGGSTLRDYVQASGELGYFQHQWAVYAREGMPCPLCRCRRGIRRLVQAGRSTFYCASRQR